MVYLDPDVLINLGDNCGGTDGYKSTALVTDLVRSFFPNKPFLACLGNHDYWKLGKNSKRPSLEDFVKNLESIKSLFKENKIHFFDTDGPYRHEDFYGFVFFGHSLWYGNSNPPTNDFMYLPHHIEGDTNGYLQRSAYKAVLDATESLREDDIYRIFCSHFPVVCFNNEFDYLFGGSPSFGDNLKNKFNVYKFFNGHAHQRHEGPLRYESGSDYGNPGFIIINL